MHVTLEELYSGALRKFALQKNVICDKCEGRGGKKGAAQECRTCRGTGTEIITSQLVPGLIQQQESICRNCHGQGEIINAKDRCKQCNGKKTLRDRNILEVNIEKGMRDKQRIMFNGQGNQEPGLQPGDIIIILNQKKHDVFKRVEHDLLMLMELQLVEALCGFQKVIKTLDGRDLVITHLPGEIVKNEDFKYIMGEGMPHHKNPFEKGRLIIQFSIVFPISLPQEIIPALEQCLPPRPTVEIPIDAEEYTLVSF